MEVKLDNMSTPNALYVNLLEGSDTINLPMSAFLCARHGEPCKSTSWLAEMDLVKAIVDSNSFKLFRTLNPWKDIYSLLMVKPACCAIDKSDLFTAYVKSKLGVFGTCVKCNLAKQPGTYYRMRDSAGVNRPLKHLCFNCLVYNTYSLTERAIERMKGDLDEQS